MPCRMSGSGRIGASPRRELGQAPTFPTGHMCNPCRAYPSQALQNEVTVANRVWIFGDLPVGRACGPSYMVESWNRELARLGLEPRVFTPGCGWRTRSRNAAAVTFRAWRHIGYVGDYHARFSSLAELYRARKDRPHVVLVTTLGRVGVLGITLAAFYSIPLVLVVSTDTTGAAAHYNTTRIFSSGGTKPAVLLLVSRRIRAALFRRSQPLAHQVARRSARFAARCAVALHAQAREVVLLSPKSVAQYGRDLGDATVTVFPVGIDRLPPAPVPDELAWRPAALRVLYVGRLAPEKGLAVLVRALRLVTDGGLDVHLALVGEGPEAGRLAELGARLGVSDRLTMIGPYPRRSLGGIYASADVFAFPSVVDTQAFVLNEAAHEALPLLVSDTANCVVRDGESALVVPQSPAEYARALDRLRDPELRRRLGSAARQRACQVGELAQTARLAEVLQRAIRGGEHAVAELPAGSHAVVLDLAMLDVPGLDVPELDVPVVRFPVAGLPVVELPTGTDGAGRPWMIRARRARRRVSEGAPAR